jgi:phage replication O-like protein O
MRYQCSGKPEQRQRHRRLYGNQAYPAQGVATCWKVAMNGSSPDNGFTKIPNELLDNMDKLSESELRVALAIARKTLGWQREQERLTFSEFESVTGLSRTAVRDGINQAIKHGVISRDQVGAQAFAYRIPVGLSYQFDDATGSNSLPEPVGLSYQLEEKPVGLSYSHIGVKKTDKEKKETIDVAHAHEGIGGGGDSGSEDDLRERLAGFSFTERQIDQAIKACGPKLTNGILDRWSTVIKHPPRGLDNPTGTMSQSRSQASLQQTDVPRRRLR